MSQGQFFWWISWASREGKKSCTSSGYITPVEFHPKTLLLFSVNLDILMKHSSRFHDFLLHNLCHRVKETVWEIWSNFILKDQSYLTWIFNRQEGGGGGEGRSLQEARSRIHMMVGAKERGKKLQHCAIFHNRKSTERGESLWKGAGTGNKAREKREVQISLPPPPPPPRPPPRLPYAVHLPCAEKYFWYEF